MMDESVSRRTDGTQAESPPERIRPDTDSAGPDRRHPGSAPDGDGEPNYATSDVDTTPGSRRPGSVEPNYATTDVESDPPRSSR